MSETWIVIPTYWTNHLVTGVFDHPTPVNGDSTLPRLLESLEQQSENRFDILILAGGVDEQVLYLAEDAAAKIVTAFANRLAIRAFGISTLAAIRRKFDLPATAFNLTTYAGIRNLQLVVPNMAGAEQIIGLDDDEVVNPEYVSRALNLISRSVNGERVLGLAGPYEDANGRIDLQESEMTGNIFLDKARTMNAGLLALINQPARITISPQVFGGNMIFHRDLFTKVGFDPGITRGEDMDYMINSHLQGINWFIAPDLRITHLPPKQYDAPTYSKMKQDVIRFVYERAKLQMYEVHPEQFDPYPGRFLREDLDDQALKALHNIGSPSLITKYGAPQEILDQAYLHTKKMLPTFKAFSKDWLKWMGATSFVYES